MAGNEPVTSGPEIQGPSGGGEDNPYTQTHLHYSQNAPAMVQVYGMVMDTVDKAYHQQISGWAETQADSPGGGGAGQLTCSLGELKKYRQQVDMMVDAAQQDIEPAKRIAQAQPTAQDADGSVMYADKLGQWGQDLLDEVNKTHDELRQYRDHLDAVIKSYANQEDSAQVSFKDFQGRL
ncbi:hypothetical protein [Sciscionella marina]|uniref:hypothetical protein n=1 Tax=Sciscionella marina TaxID=508770 RepID=UPI000362F628|nr:hypothetical protein [Sciscionella marina]